MSKLDFSGINRIAHNGEENQPEERVPLLSAEKAQPEPAHRDGKATASAFTDRAGIRDYKRMYRVAYEFHDQHNPPTVNREYWRNHDPGIDEPPAEELAYWERMAKDMGDAANVGGSDPLLVSLLIAIIDELEREYKAIREEAHRTGSSEKPQKAS